MNYIPCATFSCAWSCCYLLLVDVLRQTDDQQFQMLFVAEVGSCRWIMPLTWTTPCATRPVASIVEERKKSWNSNVEIDSLKKRLYNNHTLWTQILWSGTPPKKTKKPTQTIPGMSFLPTGLDSIRFVEPFHQLSSGMLLGFRKYRSSIPSWVSWLREENKSVEFGKDGSDELLDSYPWKMVICCCLHMVLKSNLGVVGPGGLD